MDYKVQFQAWLDSPVIDDKSKDELRALAAAGDGHEIEDRFYRELEFGTGGLRGKIGVGLNRMNVYTVRKATQGLANYLNDHYQKGSIRVALGFDSRHFSPEFAQEAALCLAANGIKAYIFDSLRPTPMLSFALRYHHCRAGIVITASHNLAIYNGYKVYGEDGAQITFPVDQDIIKYVNAVTDFASVKTMDQDEAQQAGLYEVMSAEVDEAYYAAVKSQVVNPEMLRQHAADLKIVYTPLHGTGNIPVRKVLADLGFSQVQVVPQQEMPDGAFSTVRSPNPEDPAAFSLALDLARKSDADVVLATDPDADRIGMWAKDKNGEYHSFTGNMSGMLMLHYICSQKKASGKLPSNGAVVSTIVSGKMARKICAEFNLDLILTLTGFKYIGEQIRLFEQNHDHEYVFGYEESYGALIGTHARDKDAVVSTMMLCEVAAYCKSQGRTMCDYMEELYQKYGYFKESLATVTLEGKDGVAQISGIMERLRSALPAKVGHYQVLSVCDYKLDQKHNLKDGSVTTTGLPHSNVLYFELDHDSWFCIRPSGTEPKIKLYCGISAASAAEAEADITALSSELSALLKP